MYETFNMGMGYVIIVDPESRIDFINTLRNRIHFKEIGHVENGSGIELPSLEVSYLGYY
jgi:phosphoribosylformylglycinamidine cyclo-ligase